MTSSLKRLLVILDYLIGGEAMDIIFLAISVSLLSILFFFVYKKIQRQGEMIDYLLSLHNFHDRRDSCFFRW